MNNGRAVIVGLVVVELLAFCAAAAPSQQASGSGRKVPVIACDQPEYDFGSVDCDTVVRHPFVIENRGEAPLHIRGVEGLCCGATAELGTAVIAPGSKTVLNVAFRLRGRRGPQRKVIRIQSDDPVRPILPIELVGNAMVLVDVRPRSVDFGGDLTNAAATRYVDIVCAPDYGFHVTNTETTAGWINVSVDSADPCSHRLAVRVVSPIPVGGGTAEIGLLTDSRHAEYRRIAIPVVAEGDGDIVALPRSIQLMDEEGAEPVTRFVLVRSRSATPFEILAVEPPDKDIQVTCLPLGKAEYRCEIKNLKGLPDLDGRCIVLKTSHKASPQVSVPIRVLSP